MSLALSLMSALIIITINANFISEFSGGLILLFVCVAFYLAGKIYSREWGLVKKKSNLKIIFERIWLPLLTVYIFSKNDFLFTESVFENLLIILLIISLADIDNSISRFVDTKFSDVNEVNRKICYLKYPPRDRVDIFPMEIIFHILSIVILIKKLT